jgi:adenylate cyclase
MQPRKLSFLSHLLRRRYRELALLLTLLVCVALALSMRPIRQADGRYDQSPYGIVTPLENRALDLLFQLRDARHPELRGRGQAEPITIIEVDERSIRASNVRLQNWPREWYARLVNRAREGGAKVVGLDVYLSEKGGDYADEGETGSEPPDRDREADRALTDALYETENVVLVQKLEAGGVPAITPLPFFADNATAVGFADLPHDSDNAVRSAQLVVTPPGGEPQFSFGAALAQLYTGQMLEPESERIYRFGDRRLPLRNDYTLQLDFRGRTPSFRRVSAADLISFGAETDAPPAPLDPDLFRDRIVLIGATNNDAPDLFQTPFYEPAWPARLFDRALPLAPARMPGVEIHATTAATLLFGQSITRPSYWWQVAFVCAALALVALAIFLTRAVFGLAAVLLVSFGTLALSMRAFEADGLILPLASTWVGLAALAPLGFLLRFAHEHELRQEKEAERAQIMDIFSRCVSHEVAEELWQKRDQVSLVGEKRVVTIIFTDIRGFTTLSESADSKQVVEWLNEYFSRMHRIISFYGGHINKYIGDGLMIVFGAPVDRGDKLEARAAVLCGIKMLEEIERINEDWAGTGRPHIAIGVGIHTGEATCGVVGAPGRLEYTIIGDTVNLSARLESATKEAGVSLLVSAATAERLGVDYEMEPLGEVKVKGKTESTKVFTVRQKTLPVATSNGSAAVRV